MQKKTSAFNQFQQIELGISAKLVYHPEKFIEHSGVLSIRKALLHILNQEHYPVISIVGGKRSGKTHLAHFLNFGLRQAAERFEPRIEVEFFQGTEFLDSIQEGRSFHWSNAKHCILIDDADQLLVHFSRGNSGPMVKCIEDLRVHGGLIIFFRAEDSSFYEFDEHLGTRFAAGTEFLIGNPDRSELSLLLQALSAQRGWRFNDRMVKYLEKRLCFGVKDIESYLERVQLLSRLRTDKVDFSLLGDAL